MTNPIVHLSAAVSAAALVVSLHASSPAVAAVGGRPDTLVVTPRASTVRWSGASLGGTVGVASGMLTIRHEQLESGNFTVDMPTLAVSEVPAGGALTRRAARARLTGAAGFDVDRHPTATFVSSGAERTGPSRWRVRGDLTMHGETHPLAFDVDVRWAEPGHMVATTSLALDAKAWGVGGGVMSDPMRVAVTLDARRKLPGVATRAR